MDRAIDGTCRVLELAAAALLAAMVVLVFGNVVLRYAFNSGISVSEEAARWAFVWMVYLTSVSALRRREHLGMDMVVRRLPPAGRKACALAGHGLMLFATWLLFDGSLQQVKINWATTAPATGWSMGMFYLSGLVFAVGAAVVLADDLFKIATGRIAGDDLVMIRESEDEAAFEALQAELAREQAAEAVGASAGAAKGNAR